MRIRSLVAVAVATRDEMGVLKAAWVPFDRSREYGFRVVYHFFTILCYNRAGGAAGAVGIMA